MTGSVILYYARLHDDQNTLPTWFQEVISSYVSTVNNFAYSYANHSANACHLISLPEKAEMIEAVFQISAPGIASESSQLVMSRYAEKLTIFLGDMQEADVSKKTGGSMMVRFKILIRS